MKAFIKTAILSLVFLASFNAYAVDSSTEKTYDETTPAIVITADHPQFTIKLKSNPTTGFSWFLRALDTRYVEPVEHSYQPSQDKKLIGAGGFEIWTFEMKPEAFVVPQRTTLRFVNARPWENKDPRATAQFWISTAAKTKS